MSRLWEEELCGWGKEITGILWQSLTSEFEAMWIYYLFKKHIIKFLKFKRLQGLELIREFRKVTKYSINSVLYTSGSQAETQ